MSVHAGYPGWLDHMAEMAQPYNDPGESIPPPTAVAPIFLSASRIPNAASHELSNGPPASVDGEPDDDAFNPYVAAAGS